MAMPDLASLVHDSTSIDEVTRVLSKPTAPFLLQHHPNAWEVATEGLDKPTWVPILHPRIIRMGANGMRTTKPGAPASDAYQRAIDIDSRHGVTTIPLDLIVKAEHLPNGMPEGRYIRTVDVTDPATKANGTKHIEAWQTPAHTPMGQVQEFTFDRAAYNRWRVHLVVAGVVGKPPGSVIEKAKRKHGTRVAMAEVANLPDEVRKRRVEEQMADLNAVNGAVIPEAPKPRKVK